MGILTDGVRVSLLRLTAHGRARGDTQSIQQEWWLDLPLHRGNPTSPVPVGFQALVACVTSALNLSRPDEHAATSIKFMTRDAAAFGLPVADAAMCSRLGTGGHSSVFAHVRPGGAQPVAVKAVMNKALYKREVAALGLLETAAPGVLYQRLVYSGVAEVNDWPCYTVVTAPVGVPAVANLLRMRGADDLNRRRQRADRVMHGVLQVLASAHGVGLLHLDVRPENVITVSDAPDADTGVLIDWNCSLKEGSIVQGHGTAAFSAPAMWNLYTHASHHHDLYSAALTYAALLLGALSADGSELRLPWQPLPTRDTIIADLMPASEVEKRTAAETDSRLDDLQRLVEDTPLSSWVTSLREYTLARARLSPLGGHSDRAERYITSFPWLKLEPSVRTDGGLDFESLTRKMAALSMRASAAGAAISAAAVTAGASAAGLPPSGRIHAWSSRLRSTKSAEAARSSR